MISHLQNHLTNLEQELLTLSEHSKNFPQGNLICTYNGPSHKYSRWYVHLDGITQYLPQSERTLAEKLAWKKYVLLRIEELRKEEKHIRRLLNLLQSPSKANQLLMDDRYRSLLSPYIQPNSEQLIEWQNESYQRNPYHPEHLTHSTAAGYMVRSKSESIISQGLTRYQIPHRYECALAIGDRVIFPDFTILHPISHKLYYWEHNGMIDNQNYQIQTIKKISDYVQAGICPGDQLILTYETLNMPLNASLVDKIIRNTFL